MYNGKKQGAFFMAFISWAELHRQMLDDLSSGNWDRVQSYSISTGGSTRTVSYRTWDDFQKQLVFVASMAQSENPHVYGRTFADNGGRG